MSSPEQEKEIRRTIYELFGTPSSYCRAYKMSDGSIYIDTNDGLDCAIDSAGEYMDDPEELTSEQKESASIVPCPTCPNFDECFEIDMIIDDYKLEYGEALSVEDVKKAKKQEGKPRLELSPWVFECPFCMEALTVPANIDNVTAKCPACKEEIFLCKDDGIKNKFIRRKEYFTIECPFCQQRIDVPNKLQNTVEKCPACNEEIYLTKEDKIG